MRQRYNRIAFSLIWLIILISALQMKGKPQMSCEKISATIDARKTGEPISKYIYGQFIEQMGRCIYGGIWAEMLDDRKFFYQPGFTDSPWKVIESNGIQQDGLGLIKGKDYTGRIVLKADNKTKVQISLVWGDRRQTTNIDVNSPDYKTFPFKFTSGNNTDDGKLEIIGGDKFQIMAVSLMPADNIKRMRADTLKLLKELNAPIYRWPGGNFVSGYDWRDGIGDRDKRLPKKNPAWKGIEYNDFGIDEFIVFCREINTEPLIVVNSGLGDANSAAEEVRYVNITKKYNVKWWGIGNEMYGSWQLGHMPLDDYTHKHNLFAKAMRDVDPSIKLIAVGDAGAWSEGMLKNCAENMDLISEHFYCKEKENVIEHTQQMPQAVSHKVAAHRQYRKDFESLKGKDIRIALDEWNYWYGDYIFGELGTRYFLKDALGIAEGLHEMFRNSDLIEMANYAQTVNVIGAIKTNKTTAEIETTGLVLKLYRNQFGTLPVGVSSDTKPLDVAAALTADRKFLTIAIVNPTENKYILSSGLKADKGMLWSISNPDPLAFNDPGKAPAVTIEEKQLSNISDTLDVLPLSVCLYKLEVKNGM